MCPREDSVAGLGLLASPATPPPSPSLSPAFESLYNNVKIFVPKRGLEPPHLTASPPHGYASTNFATWAYMQYI